MLKKLVKYGNSHALILDRSIMALLEIEEGAVVKLRIEGNALIVRAEKNIQPTDALMTEMESMEERTMLHGSTQNPVMDRFRQSTQAYCKKIEKEPGTMQLLKEWAPGTENYQKLQEAYGVILKKYQEEMKPLSSPEFKKQTQKLAKKYQSDESSQDYYRELQALRLKFSPGLAKMDEEMQAVSEALGYPLELADPSLCT